MAIQEGDTVTRLQAMYRASALSGCGSKIAGVKRAPEGFIPVRVALADLVPAADGSHSQLAASYSSLFYDDHLIWSDSPGDTLQNYFGRPCHDIEDAVFEIAGVTKATVKAATPRGN